MQNETLDYDKWLGKRLKEILEERHLTNLSEIERETGIGRKNIERILKNGRKIQFEELHDICDYLGLQIQRFLCNDTKSLVVEIERHIHDNKLDKALMLARSFDEIALGVSERAKSKIYIGEILLEQKCMIEAGNQIHAAFELAKKSMEKQLIHSSSDKLLTFYFYSSSFKEMKNFILNNLDVIQDEESDLRQGKINHYLGMCSYYLGEKIEACVFFEKAIGYYSKVEGSEIDVARLRVSVAEIELQKNNYTYAKELLVLAEKVQRNDRFKNYLTTRKDLSRVHLLLGEMEDSLSTIEQTIEMIDQDEKTLHEILAKLLIMKASILEDKYLAIDVIDMLEVSSDTKRVAAYMVVDFFIEGGDVSREVLKKCYAYTKSECGEFENFIRGDKF